MSWLSSTLSWVLGLFYPQSTGDPTKVAQIQATAVKVCGFLPMAETVTAILASICKVVTKVPTPIATMGLMSSGDAESPPVYGEVNGVPVQGVFVGK
jgi:hypothetical protein